MASFQNLFDFGRCAHHARFSKSAKIFGAGPSRGAIQHKRHIVIRQIYGCRNKVIDRCKPGNAQDIIVDDAEILQVCVAVTQAAVNRNQRKQFFKVLDQMRRLGKLLEPLHDGAFVTAAVFLIGAFSVKDAEILETAIRAVRTEVESINDERRGVFREAVGRHIQAAPLRDPETKTLIRGALRVFVGFPEFDDVRRPR